MVNFCVFSLLLSYAPQEPSGNISLWSPPLPSGKLGKLTPLPPGKIRSFPWGGVWIFSGTTHNHLSSQFFVNIVSTTAGFIKWWLWIMIMNAVKDSTHAVPSLLWWSSFHLDEFITATKLLHIQYHQWSAKKSVYIPIPLKTRYF